MWNDGTELYHYGIKGQKWGVRRWQNDDGSFNDEGKIRYGRISLWKESFKTSHKNSKSNSATNKSRLDKNKLRTIAKIGMAAAGTALAVYGAKQIYENYNATREIDPITGLPLKPKDHTLSDDIRHQNPGAIYVPGFGMIDLIRGSTCNCALNTLNIEMNRRGYDTYPGLSTTGLSPGQIYSMWKKDGVNIWQDSDIANDLVHTVSSENNDFDEIEKKILSIYPEGARGNLNFYYGLLEMLPIPQKLRGKLMESDWFEDIPLGGHSVAWEIENGKVVIRDGQIGLVKSTLKDHLKGAILNENSAYGGIELFRYDDLEPDLDYIKKNNFLRTDNNTKFIIDNLWKIPANVLTDTASMTTISSVAAAMTLVNRGYKNIKERRTTRKHARKLKKSRS